MSPVEGRPVAADVVTAVRLVLAPALPPLARRPRAFVAAAALGGLSDLLDGPITRRCGTAGDRGARLDSLADAAFFAGVAVACARAAPAQCRRLAPFACGVGVLRGVAALVGTARWGRPVLLHTWSDKLAGLATAAGLVVLTATGRSRVLAGAGVVAAGAAIEEIWWVATSQAVPDVDGPGVLGSVASRLVGRASRRRVPYILTSR